MPIHITWRLQNTFHMFNMDAGLFWVGLQPQPMNYVINCNQWWPTFSSWGGLPWSRLQCVVRMDDDGPKCLYLQIMETVQHLSYVWQGYKNHSERVYSLNHWIMESMLTVLMQDFQLTLEVWVTMCINNGVMMDHMPIHIMWRLLHAFRVFDMDPGIILSGSKDSTIELCYQL